MSIDNLIFIGNILIAINAMVAVGWTVAFILDVKKKFFGDHK